MRKLLVTFLMFFSFVVYAETPTVSLADPALGNKQYIPDTSAADPALGNKQYIPDTSAFGGADHLYPKDKKTWAVGEPIDLTKMSTSGYFGSCGAAELACYVDGVGRYIHDCFVQLFAWFIQLFLYFSFIAFEASYKFSINIIEQYNVVQNMQEAFSLIPSKYVAVLIYIAIPQLFSACITALITVFMFRRVFARFA